MYSTSSSPEFHQVQSLFLKRPFQLNHFSQIFSKKKSKFPARDKTYPPKNENCSDMSPKNEI